MRLSVVTVKDYLVTVYSFFRNRCPLSLTDPKKNYILSLINPKSLGQFRVIGEALGYDAVVRHLDQAAAPKIRAGYLPPA